MGVAERVRDLLAGHRLLVTEIDDTTAEVTHDPPEDRSGRALHRLQEAGGVLAWAGLDITQEDMQLLSPGLLPGMSDGTRTPNRARPIIPSGPPRLVVRER